MKCGKKSNKTYPKNWEPRREGQSKEKPGKLAETQWRRRAGNCGCAPAVEENQRKGKKRLPYGRNKKRKKRVPVRPDLGERKGTL